MINAWGKLECLIAVASVLRNNFKHDDVIKKNKDDIRISPKGVNIPGTYRECEEGSCTRLIPCPHVRCQEHRTDMATKDWVVSHIEP